MGCSKLLTHSLPLRTCRLPPATDPTKETQRVRPSERKALDVGEDLSWDKMAPIDAAAKVVTIKKASGGRRTTGNFQESGDKLVSNISELPPAIVPVTSFTPATIRTDN